MDTRPVRVPMPMQTRYVGPLKRYFILAVYCVYALVTGLVMFAANLGLFLAESVLDLGWTLNNVPASVNDMIDAGNSKILAGSCVVLDEPDPVTQDIPGQK